MVMNDQWYLVMLLMMFAVAIALIAVCIVRRYTPPDLDMPEEKHFRGEPTEEVEVRRARSWH